MREAVDAWAAKQKDAPSRSEAIRRLVELGLKKSRNSSGTQMKTGKSQEKT
jgi:metal-responsive CopG/Arc/MetJ family transcriptional regulator